MRLDEIVPAPGVLEAQAAHSDHVKQSDAFITAVKRGDALPPLIVIGTEPVMQPDGSVRLLMRPFPEVGTVPMLADGYHRYRALKLMGVQEARVVRQVRQVAARSWRPLPFSPLPCSSSQALTWPCSTAICSSLRWRTSRS